MFTTKMVLSLLVHGLLILIVTLSVEPLKPLESELETSEDQEADLRNLLDLIINAQSFGRRLNSESLAKARAAYKKITKNMSKAQIKKWLRQKGRAEVENEELAVRSEQTSLVESELKNALFQKKSALYDRPYVEKSGKNDFLVINHDVKDPFVTVIPNALYYNAEKKCVNWLDDCSLKGIRQRLLRGVRSP